MATRPNLHTRDIVSRVRKHSGRSAAQHVESHLRDGNIHEAYRVADGYLRRRKTKTE